MIIIEGKCDCIAFRNGLACWHITHLVNVFRRGLIKANKGSVHGSAESQAWGLYNSEGG